ncbi:MAG: patatin-like phospholipase family protein [Sphaerochaeta sp.]
MAWPFSSNPPPHEEHRYILSIDGGGMRGIVPATILANIATQLEAQGSTIPLYAYFDLIAGTSTGGLLALGLSIPAPKSNLPGDGKDPIPVYEDIKGRRFFGGKPKQRFLGTIPPSINMTALEELYFERGSTIFPKSQTRRLGQIFVDKYDEQPLERFLFEMFGNTPLAEANVPTLIVAYDSDAGQPFYLTSYESGSFLYWEAGRATSAAPTFFRPASLYDREHNKRINLIDGGVIANNPALFAYQEAKKLYPEATHFHILSLSTASVNYTFKTDGSSTGVIGWIDPTKGAPIQKIYASAQLQAVDSIAKAIPDLSYTRVHGEAGRDFKMDETDPRLLEELHYDAQEIYAKNEEQIQRFLHQIQGRTTFNHVRLEEKSGE